jgi:phage repressor protein C with HTH and peptisase S24 domain
MSRPMINLLRVSGYSLWPSYRDGDFVVTAGTLLAGPIRPGDVIVFRQPDYGIMIKQVQRLDEHGIFVVGTHERSADSREFGAISRTDVIGKVIWHITYNEK